MDVCSQAKHQSWAPHAASWASTVAVCTLTHRHVSLHCSCEETNVLPEGNTSCFSWQRYGVGACGTGRVQFLVQSVAFGAGGYPGAELEVARRRFIHLRGVSKPRKHLQE